MQPVLVRLASTFEGYTSAARRDLMKNHCIYRNECGMRTRPAEESTHFIHHYSRRLYIDRGPGAAHSALFDDPGEADRHFRSVQRPYAPCLGSGLMKRRP